MTSMIPCEILTGIGIGAILVIAFWPLVRKCCEEEEEDVPAPTPLLTGYSPITATNSMLYSKSRQLFVYAFN